MSRIDTMDGYWTGISSNLEQAEKDFYFSSIGGLFEKM